MTPRSSHGSPEPDTDDADELIVYSPAAVTWREDLVGKEAASRRIAWIVASVAACIAVLEALALAGLAPLKTVVPYTVLVDRTTGYTELVDGSHPKVLQPQSALTQSLLAQYVIARETFDISTIAEQYRKVGLWSKGQARQDYVKQMASRNPASPLAGLSRSTKITVEVLSVSLVSKDKAQVRFLTHRKSGIQDGEAQQGWVAWLTYGYVGEPMSLENRLVNPLGFVVSAYRRDQEVVVAPTPARDVP